MNAKTRITRHLEDYAPYYFVVGMCVVFTVGMPILFGLASRYPNSVILHAKPVTSGAYYTTMKTVHDTVRDFGR